MLKQFGLAIWLCFALCCAGTAHARFIEFSTTNIQLLKGWGYEVGSKNRAIATFEHFNRWTYGDFFMFSDVTRYNDGGSNIYAEFSPRLSLSKISGQDLSYGVINDVLVSSTFEVGKRGYNASLYGGAVNLNLPGFNFATVNLYNRDNPALKGSTWQSTIAWQAPFEIAGLKCISEGFMDFAGREGPR